MTYLPATCLTISEDADIVTICTALCQLRDIFEYVSLGGVRLVDLSNNNKISELEMNAENQNTDAVETEVPRLFSLLTHRVF